MKHCTPNKDEFHTLREKSDFEKRNIHIQRWLFFKERKKAIIFRILAAIAIAFDVYSVYKKYKREHYFWVIFSVIFLVVPVGAVAVYSLWCEIIENHSSMNKKKQEPKEKAERGVIYLTASGSTQGFDDDIITLGSDESDNVDDDSPELDTNHLNPEKKIGHKKRGVSFEFEETSPKAEKVLKNKIKLKGTYVQPGIVDPKMDNDCNEILDNEPTDNLPILSLKEFWLGILNCSWPMLISHILLFPKEYHFCRTSSLLLKYFKQPFHNNAENHLKNCNIKEVSYQPLWNKYCYREIISKQLSFLIATFQSLPMTVLDLLYWSVESKNIANYTTLSFFDAESFGGEQFNIFELTSLLINMCSISYKLVSLMNQIRRINFAKQDMKLLHLVYLTVVYFILLSSRIISICFIMCLNWSSVLFTLSLLLVQFITSNLVSWNLYKGVNSITVLISNLLMIFLYVPPRSNNNRRISMLSYHIIIFSEILLMFIFGYYQLLSDSNISLHIFVVGQKIPRKGFYMGFGCSLFLLVFGVVLNSEVLSRCLFKYHIITKRENIRKVLREVNDKHKTEYEIITGQYGQNKESFSVQQTIHLF